MAREGLTIKQERFAQNLFSGMTQREAYKQSYSCENMTDKSIDEEACVLANSPKIASRIDELTSKLVNKTIWTVEEILKDIKEIANDKDSRRLEKLKALELGGKHLGMFTDKLSVSGGLINENHNYDMNIFDEAYQNESDENKLILDRAMEIIGKWGNK